MVLSKIYNGVKNGCGGAASASISRLDRFCLGFSRWTGRLIHSRRSYIIWLGSWLIRCWHRFNPLWRTKQLEAAGACGKSVLRRCNRLVGVLDVLVDAMQRILRGLKKKCLAIVSSECSPRRNLPQTLQDDLRIDEEWLSRITENRFVRKKQLSYSNEKVADRLILCCSDPILYEQ